MRPAPLILLLVMLASLSGSAGGDEKKSKKEDAEAIDYLGLAARLVKDGHYDRAALTLDQVDVKSPGLDLERYHVLRGLVSLKRKLYVAAADSFERAIRAGNTDPLVYLNLGRARFGKMDYRGAVAALEKAGAAGEREPAAAELKSRAYWKAGRPGAALEVLRRAARRFPESVEFPRTEILYLIQLDLFQEVARRRAAFTRREDVSALDLAAIGEALRESGRLAEAASTLEVARLRFSDDERLTVALARVLLDRGSTLSAAMLLEDISRLHPKYLSEAAELYRRAGRLERALFINQQIADQKVKIKQRLQILLEMERFEMIAAMEARLSRLGLLGDEQLRYALAYGLFMIRDFDAAERHLERIKDPDLFAKGIKLREAIEACRHGGWECR